MDDDEDVTAHCSDDSFVLGQDVVLREREILTELLSALPRKAQLGFSSLKDKFSNTDKSLKRIMAAAKTNDSLKIEYTCIDVTPQIIVLGCNLGIVFLFERKAKVLSRLICENKQIPIVSIKLLVDRQFIATGQFSGAVTIFRYEEEKNSFMKANLKCTVESHHTAPITSVLWTPDGMKLFTADSEGNVAITVINMDEGKTHTVFICKEDSPVTQLTFSHTALLISTLRRTLVWPFNTKTTVQVGKQGRKVFGNFGACFIPPAGALPSNVSADIYAARPGLRLWKATSEGKVVSTMMFKDSVSKGEPVIETINLPSHGALTPRGEQKQFGSLLVFNEQFLVTWQGSHVWVIDPNTGYIIGCHSNLGCVVGVCCSDNELFVLSKSEENFIRKINFETETPCIVVEELNLNNPQDIKKVQDTMTSSVSHFEDQDRLDKLTDEVVSKMKRSFSDVKSRVMEIKDQIRSRDVSEDDRVSDNASPRIAYKNRGGTAQAVLSGEGCSTADENQDGFTSDENIINENRPFESSTEITNSTNQDDSIVCTDKMFDLEITHKKREKVSKFDHLSKEAFPDIVFEGTSLGSSPNRKKKKVKANKDVKSGMVNSSASDSSPISKASSSQETVGDEDSKANLENQTSEHQDNMLVNGSSISEPDPDEDSKTLCEDEGTISEEQAKVQANANAFKRVNSTWGEEILFDNEQESSLINEVPTDTHRSVTDDSIVVNRENLENLELNIKSENMSTHKTEEENLLPDVVCNLVSSYDLLQSDINVDKKAIDAIEPTDDRSKLHNYIVNSKNISFEGTAVQSDDAKENVANAPVPEEDVEAARNNTRNSFEIEATLNSSNLKNTDYVGTCNEKIGVAESDYTTLQKCCGLDNAVLQEEDVCSNVQLSEQSLQITSGGRLQKENENSQLEVAQEKLECNINSVAPEETINKLDSANTLTPGTSENDVVENKDDMNIVHVKISHKRQGSNVSVHSLSSERCKEIKGEALELVHIQQPLTRLLGEDDTLEANMHHQFNQEITVNTEHDEDKSLDGILYPVSPFPAPQVQSIYSQSSVNLAEFSLASFQDKTATSDEDSTSEVLGDYTQVDVDSELIQSIDSKADVEDNDSDSAVQLSASEEINTPSVPRRKRKSKHRHSCRGSYGSSPCGSDLEGRSRNPARAATLQVQDRLRYLADSWADVNLPSCGQIQHIACSNMLVWALDSHDHIFVSGVSSQVYNWKKVDGKAMQIACNKSGTVVWCVDRSKVAYYRTGIKENCPQGAKWEPFEKNMHFVAVDDECLWAIKTNGDVFVRTGVTYDKPSGAGWITIKAASDLVQLTCLDGLVWGLDIYNHVQIFQGDLDNFNDADSFSQWSELPGITVIHVLLGANGVCWVIDKDYGVWFNQDISKDNQTGGTWYQLSLGEHQAQDGGGWFSSVLSYFTQGNEPKMIISNEAAGVLMLGKQGFVHVAHGHLLGTRWEVMVPSKLTEPSCWTCVSAGGADVNKGYIWALQPNGQIFCFKFGGQSYNVQPPTRVILKYCSAGPRSLWALSAGQDVYVRLGISDSCPQGLKWLKVDMLAQGNKRLLNICCGNRVVWAVDYEGTAWFQLGKDEKRNTGFSPAWVSVDGCPLDGCQFKKIVVGPDDHIVWATDDKNNVYARKDIADNFWVGTSWEVVSGTSGKDLAISSNHVWGLCPNGDVMCRFGVSPGNVIGDYWKKVPGNFDQISVSANDELCGIDRQGQLYQRQTLLFYGSSLSRKVPSYDELFSDHNDWEFI